MTAPKPPFAGKPLGALLIAMAGPLVWALHFAVVYGTQHVVCATLAGSRAAFWVYLAVFAATAVALPVLLLLIAKPGIARHTVRRGAVTKRAQAFLTGIMRLLALLSFFGVLWAGSAALLLPACASLA
ncbi:hypothetical protein [Methylobacter marinus]|uniref:hypothetical protein n=1 Tax=Methylobacter marinus TaxID=34058 RepID=UPI000368FFB1|nr:hypothetical protein [Methylobacter marinus]